MKKFTTKNFFFVIGFFQILICNKSFSANKISLTSGIWNSAAIWSPVGVPAAGDHVTIQQGHSIQVTQNNSVVNLTVNGNLSCTPNKTFTITGNLIVNGTMTMNSSDINLNTAGASFSIGPGGSFTWEPFTNSLAKATLFTNGVENFSATSTLIIKKWYNYSVPLASVVTENFGNVVLNSIASGWLMEWDQNNEFETHQIKGTLTIDQGWIALDKSGMISNTTIGNIVLQNSNSFLDFHDGDHPGTFTVTTSGISNKGGEIHGIYDGEGNVTINVTGDVTNTGYFFGVYNDGVQNVGNGNLIMNVGGTFSQSSGDFRGIYNLTTYNAGTSNLSFGNINFTGGIWMAHYACHTGGNSCSIIVSGNISINASNATDIFRGVGLSVLTSTYNNPPLNLSAGGDFSVSGNQSAQFVSCASTGNEIVSIGGNTIIEGCDNRFNYGSSTAHQTTLTFTGNFNVNGGATTFSCLEAGGTATINGALNMSGGTLAVKGNSGAFIVNVNGSFTQSGGTFFLHNNSSAASPDVVELKLNGDFTHTGGTINFDNNTLSTAKNIISMRGANYNLTGAGIITHASSETGTTFGRINFCRQGIILFSRSNTHSIHQVKQTISNGCTINIVSGNLQVASHQTPGTDYFKVENGASLEMNSNQIVSNGLAANSGIKIEAGGTLKTKRTQGLYDGTTNACISTAGNMNFFLDANSIIEYNGNDNGVITGTGVGVATTANHKYGILRINLSGTPDAEYVHPAASNVFVRTQLDLVNGEYNLSGYTLTVENGDANAIKRTNGYIKSETNGAVNSGILKWKNLNSGVHVFPFGVNSSAYIPITFSPVAGMGGTVSINTRSCGKDNKPWTGTGTTAVTNMNRDGKDISIDNVIDRWWNIDAPGFTADITIAYRGIENTTDVNYASGLFSIQPWNGSNWQHPFGTGTGVTSGIGTVSATGVKFFGTWIICSQQGALSYELISLVAKLKGNIVELNWTAATEITSDFFTVERSTDQTNWQIVKVIREGEINKNGVDYITEDQQPLQGISFYRIKVNGKDGTVRYSPVRKISTGDVNGDGTVSTTPFKITSIVPNPFSDGFKVLFTSEKELMTDVFIINSGGQTIYSEKIQTQRRENSFEFTRGNTLPKGNYIFIISGAGAKATQKIIKN